MKPTIFCLAVLLSFLILSAAPLGADPGEHSALVVIDVQKAFSDPEGFSPVCRNQADHMLPVINALVQKFSDRNREIIYIKQEYIRDTGFDARLKVLGDSRFTKRMQSAFSNPDFETYLHDRNISRLYIVGLAAEYCVAATVADALGKGLDVSVVEDGVAAKYCGALPSELETLREKGADIVRSDRI